MFRRSSLLSNDALRGSYPIIAGGEGGRCILGCDHPPEQCVTVVHWKLVVCSFIEVHDLEG